MFTLTSPLYRPTAILYPSWDRQHFHINSENFSHFEANLESNPMKCYNGECFMIIVLSVCQLSHAIILNNIVVKLLMVVRVLASRLE